MILRELALRGVWIYEGVSHADIRGSFDRIVDLTELRARVDDSNFEYVARARNQTAGTVRGLHLQAEPYGEAKTLWCETGALFDVLVDLRPDESTFGTWIGINLSAEHPAAVHVPRGIAHGYQTLVDHTTVCYLISAPYVPEAARTIHWQDPTLAISWPLTVSTMSASDRDAPLLKDSQ